VKYLSEAHGATPLQVALQTGNVDVVNILLRNGANPSIKNSMGKCALDYCEAFPELRSAIKRVLATSSRESKKTSLYRRDSTASDLRFPMYLVSLNQLQQMYGGKEARLKRIEAHQDLKQRGELVRWEDLPMDARIIFVSHEWVGWSHPDPHGIQLRTFLKIMQRLQTGEINQTKMNLVHTMIYKTKHLTTHKEWKELLDTAYVWFDWASMPQPSACPPGTDEDVKAEMGTNLGKAVKSIPAYVILLSLSLFHSLTH